MMRVPRGIGVGAIRRRLVLALSVVAGLLLVGAANWHLVHVAMVSQPGCVAHFRAGEGGEGRFGAAQSSCTPGPDASAQRASAQTTERERP